MLGGDITSTRIVTIVLVIISAAATFFTQLLVMSRTTTVPTGTAATVQKLMKVFIPISVLFSGVFFPLGVLLYWFTSNTWTLLQQLYINRYHPHDADRDAGGRHAGQDAGAQAGTAPGPRPAQPHDADQGLRRDRRTGRGRRSRAGPAAQRAASRAAPQRPGRQPTTGQAPEPGEETPLTGVRHQPPGMPRLTNADEPAEVG